MELCKSTAQPEWLCDSNLLWTECSVNTSLPSPIPLCLLRPGTNDPHWRMPPNSLWSNLGTAALSVSPSGGAEEARERKKRVDAPKNNACGAVATPSIYTLGALAKRCKRCIYRTWQTFTKRCQRCIYQNVAIMISNIYGNSINTTPSGKRSS